MTATRSRSCSVRDETLRAALEPREDGVRIALFVQPRASRDRVIGLHDGRIKLALTAPPVDGRANKALIRFLAKRLRVPTGAVSVVSGEAGRRKTVLVSGASLEVVVAGLEG